MVDGDRPTFSANSPIRYVLIVDNYTTLCLLMRGLVDAPHGLPQPLMLVVFDSKLEPSMTVLDYAALGKGT